jgi:hypothetical protein
MKATTVELSENRDTLWFLRQCRKCFTPRTALSSKMLIDILGLLRTPRALRG